MIPLLLFGLIAAVLAAKIVAYVSYNFFSLMLLFPYLQGRAVGTVVSIFGSKFDKNKLIAIAALFAIISYGFLHVETKNLVYEDAVTYYLAEYNYDNQSVSEVRTLINEVFTPSDYIGGHMEEGSSISYRGRKVIDVRGYGVFVVWFLELILCVFGAVSALKPQGARELTPEQVKEINKLLEQKKGGAVPAPKKESKKNTVAKKATKKKR